MLLRLAYSNFKFFKKDDNFIKGDSPNGSNTTTALEKNKIDDIHVADNISDGFNEIPMKYSLSPNSNVPEKCFYDFEIDLVKMVEFLKRNTLVDHALFIEENNTSYQKIIKTRENIWKPCQIYLRP